MASFSSSTAILLHFLFLAASVLPTHADPITIQEVTGRLVCSATGNPSPLCPTCGGIPGENVTITCNGATSSVVSTVLTNANGFVDTIVASPLPCEATVELPIASCPLLPSNGMLRAPVIITSVTTYVPRFANLNATALLFVNGANFSAFVHAP